jgi:hypothetical protein
LNGSLTVLTARKEIRVAEYEARTITALRYIVRYTTRHEVVFGSRASTPEDLYILVTGPNKQFHTFIYDHEL